MRFLFFLGPLCEGAPPAGGGGENLFPGDYDYIRQGRGHNVCLAVSRDGEHIDSKQCLLYNKDYPAGLTCHVRDPKVFAYESRYYICLLYTSIFPKAHSSFLFLFTILIINIPQSRTKCNAVRTARGFLRILSNPPKVSAKIYKILTFTKSPFALTPPPLHGTISKT